MTEGVLLLCKPPGPTSHDMVDVVRRSLGERRVGHAGALDPGAEGLLVVLVGRATRLAEYFGELDKTYLARAVLGHASETDDADGPLTPVLPGGPFPTREELERVLCERLTGEILQRPPAYSAVHVAGRRAYTLARRGEKVELSGRRVFVRELELLDYEPPEYAVRARVSAGTYVRSLVRDVGEALAVGSYLAALERTCIGPFTVEEAVGPGEIKPEDIIPAASALIRFMTRVEVSEEDARRIAQGRTVEGTAASGTVAAVMGEELVAVVCSSEGILAPEKVFLRSG